MISNLPFNSNNTNMKHEKTKARRSVGMISNSPDHVSGHGKGMNHHRTKGMIIMGKRSGETIEFMNRGKGAI